jgi:GT2 family glycosyltransferase
MGHIAETATAYIEVLSGAFMMMPTQLAKDLGGFDERFFMYAEDIDLSRRIIEIGYKNYYLGDISITHLKGESTAKKSAAYTRQFYLAMEQYVEKYNGANPLRKGLLLTAIKFTTALAHVKRVLKNTFS